MRDAAGRLPRVSAQALPAVPMATQIDPTLTAIDRDRIAYLAFAASLKKNDGVKAAQETGREVIRTDEDAHEAARGVREGDGSEPTDDGVWRRSSARCLTARRIIV